MFELVKERSKVENFSISEKMGESTWESVIGKSWELSTELEGRGEGIERETDFIYIRRNSTREDQITPLGHMTG